MLIFDEIINNEKALHFNRLEEFYRSDEVIMFDIETTGFSPSNSIIYLIGINYKDKNGWHITQFFNDDGKSEELIIMEFMRRLKSYKFLVHFNGDAFDIPFVKKRIHALNQSKKDKIPDYLDIPESVDLYKMMKPFKSSLGLVNLKQKTIEDFLGLHRIDEYTGGELIEVYHRYLSQNRRNSIPQIQIHNRQGNKDQSLLIQHNRDDMEGMYYLSSILSLQHFSNGEFELSDISCDADSNGNLKLKLTLSLKHPLPFRVTLSHAGIHLNAYDNSGTLIIPILSDELKFYFPDHKNYFYYPDLDMAYHKSADRSFSEYSREQAKKETCYTRRYGHFVPQLTLKMKEGFRYQFADKQSFIEIDDSFLGNKEHITQYARGISEILLKNNAII